MKYQVEVSGTITVTVEASNADKAEELVSSVLEGQYGHTPDSPEGSIDQNSINALGELEDWEIDGVKEV